MRELSLRLALDHLVERQLVEQADLFDGVELTETSRRNRSVVVRIERGGFFLKQYAEDRAVKSSQEHAFYDWFWKRKSPASRMADVVLCPVFQDSQDGILCLPYIPSESEPFAEPMGSTFLRDLASAIAWLHDIDGADYAVEAVPQMFSIFEPDSEIFSLLSPATTQILSVLQESPALFATVRYLNDWWSSKTIIHGDLKQDNVLYHEGARVVFIDWESAGAGPAEWDIGSIVQELLRHWVSAKLAGNYDPEKYLRGIRHFVAEYSLQSDIRYDRTRVIECAGIRLLQTVFEAHLDLPALRKGTPELVQLAVSILSDPDRACADFLGG